jgi:hypothetical protein
MDLIKRIYVPDLINKEFKESQVKNKEVTSNNNDKEETKKIIFTGTTTKYQMKKVDSNKEKKEKKKKVETNTWGLNEVELSFDTQLDILKNIFNNNNNNTINDSKLTNFITSHIKTKISSYKHQDLLKNIFLEPEFITFNDIIGLLNESNMKCHYCACETYLLYEFVREMKQWSLDRINNNIGHNKGNLVIACLECNLKRRRTNKDAFFMTKNLTISREGI